MHDDAERFLLDALATTEAFGWQYHRATTLIALADNRLRASGDLDAEGEAWLATAEQLCETHGIASWGRRAAGIARPAARPDPRHAHRQVSCCSSTAASHSRYRSSSQPQSTVRRRNTSSLTSA